MSLLYHSEALVVASVVVVVAEVELFVEAFLAASVRHKRWL